MRVEYARIATLRKFQQNDELRCVLLRTGDETLMYKSEDTYWYHVISITLPFSRGKNKEGKGRNKYGKILMKVRDELVEDFIYLEPEQRDFTALDYKRSYLRIQRTHKNAFEGSIPGT